MEDKGERRTRVARQPRMAGACPGVGPRRGDACVPRRGRTERRRGKEADGWARARKITVQVLKFEMKVFPGSKIHQSFSADR